MQPCGILLFMQTKIIKRLFFSPGLNKIKIQTAISVFVSDVSVHFWKCSHIGVKYSKNDVIFCFLSFLTGTLHLRDEDNANYFELCGSMN